ncbi:anti-sigma factor domain-containing protein [Pedobacter sp. ASV28]|uniref:anti-sigma factor n=1 Tax=Pedobacter sp. ASV28 TaxID=2795123 RepID=UPI0018ED4C29|nr:anti-sigma factor [Pedobacter sp. ASV28]
MDIKEYISSGIIEAYVMGLASEEEVGILMCVQKNNPEVKQAILEAEKTLEDFNSRHAINPPEELKSAIWAKISAEGEEASAQQSSDDSLTEDHIIPLNQEIKPINTVNLSLKWLSIAASVLLIVSISLNLYFRSSQNNYQAQLLDLQKKQQNTDIAYNALKIKWDIANHPNMKTIQLLGVEKHPNMKAMVYMDKSSNEVYLSLENLPSPPKDQEYQLWAIVDGKPTSMGVFDQESTEAVQKMVTVTNAQAFAITLEKKGGSEVPTLENMYVMGKV